MYAVMFSAHSYLYLRYSLERACVKTSKRGFLSVLIMKENSGISLPDIQVIFSAVDLGLALHAKQ